jgi:hypothetical protein
VSHQDRRRSLRLQATRDHHLPTGLRDVSLGGFSIETAFAMKPDAVRDFTLRGPDGAEMVLRARVVHSHHEHRSDGADVYVTGVAFLEDVSPSAGDALGHRMAS